MRFMSFYLTFFVVLFQHVNTQKATFETIREVNIPPTIQQDGSQKFSFQFKTSNNIEREEIGYKSPDPKDGFVVTGRYSYIRPDGIKEIVKYVADKNGFRVLPKPMQIGSRIAPGALASLAG
nr:endocuticle structural glycoprotein SgAbd-2-like [Onthophagus taurus]